MSDVTSATVVVPCDPESDRDSEAEAMERARRVFREFEDHRFYYHDVQVDNDQDEPAVVPLGSDAGQERAAERLEQTTQSRKRNLEEILEVVEEADSVAEAAKDTDLFSAAHELGAYHHPKVGYFFDGCNWKFGSPILNEDHLNEIVEHHEDEELFLVDIELTY